LFTVHPTDNVIKKISLRVATATGATFEPGDHLAEGELWDDDEVLLGSLVVLMSK